ncbi:hypothetical protein ACPPVO_26970 [Dactylosporangium sp. McL0621]|uniref:hypothetical protein n=1 Tax=Dactylosporangium sp. McL0621 TaxID=3415678 RepID=UPI003CEF63B8
MATCADDALPRALAGVSGERLAATVAAHDPRHVLEDAGAAVTAEPFTVPFVPEVYAEPSVRWSGGPLAAGREVAVHLASADRPLVRRGELVVAGGGDPAGRWLVVPAGMTLFAAYGHAHGALGLLVPRGVDADGWRYTIRTGPNPGPLPILTLDTGIHAEVARAAAAGDAWLAGSTPIRRLDRPGVNRHGRWRSGTAPELLLTAQADDAGGVAVVLEAARVLAAALPGAAGLSVALLGAQGSAHHARQLHKAGATPLVIHVAGAGDRADAVPVEARGPAHALLAALDQAGRHTGLTLAPGPVPSAHRRYAAVGLAAVGIGAAAADTAVARLVVATGLLCGHVTGWTAAGPAEP